MTAPPPSRGRLLAGLGVLAALGGIALYAGLLFGAKKLHMPWYMLGLAVLGVILVLASLRARRTIPRFLALLMVVALAGFEAWILFSFSRNPDYTGPAAGAAFPTTFSARLADGQPFTSSELFSQNTLLVFYRGHF